MKIAILLAAFVVYAFQKEPVGFINFMCVYTMGFYAALIIYRGKTT